MVHSPALVLFDPGKPAIVSTDASDYGVGAVGAVLTLKLNIIVGSQVAERVEHLASNLKVASSIPGRCT